MEGKFEHRKDELTFWMPEMLSGLLFASASFLSWHLQKASFCPPPHEVRKGDYCIRHRLSVRPAVMPTHFLAYFTKSTIISKMRGL